MIHFPWRIHWINFCIICSGEAQRKIVASNENEITSKNLSEALRVKVDELIEKNQALSTQLVQEKAKNLAIEQLNSKYCIF